ncbi:MAG: esterase, partial [Caulobacter sp.]|nr:esterase [Caulobacter sp.]
MKAVWASMAMAIFLAASGTDLQAASPPPAANAKAVTVEHIKVHGAALEGNLEGESPDRDVVVYLPPGYAADTARRYPVVYALHGYGLTADGFAGLLQTPQTAEGAFAA